MIKEIFPNYEMIAVEHHHHVVIAEWMRKQKKAVNTQLVQTQRNKSKISQKQKMNKDMEFHYDRKRNKLKYAYN